MATSCLGLLLSVLAVLALVRAASSSNILYFMPFGSPSHVTAIVPLLEALSAKGHNVTFLTEFVPSSTLHNPVHVIHLKDLEDIYELNRPNSFELKSTMNMRLMMDTIALMSYEFCEGLVTHPVFVEFARTGPASSYEVVIMDGLLSECGLSLLPLLGNPPLIYYCTSTLYEFTANALDVPTPLSYVPSFLLPTNGRMTFSERLTNTLAHLAYKALRSWYIYPTQQAIVRKYFPDTPLLSDLEANASLVLTNSNSHSLDLVRPLAPFVVEVGATHCRPAKPLPKDVEQFLTGSGRDGFIFFSLGSNVRSNELPPKKIAAFLGAFRRLKQNVLWKFESNLPDLPPNVQIRKWVSQQDVLGHSDIRLFLSHGGQLSTQEAIYHGVPVLGFPVYGDQLMNVGKGVYRGFARLLDYDDLSEETVYEAITEMLRNTSYKEKSVYYSSLMRDRPMDPVVTAVYWVEYVIRHKGASHLHFTAAKQLNFFQYFLLDILALIILIFSATLFCFIQFGKFVFRNVCKKRSVVSATKKRK